MPKPDTFAEVVEWLENLSNWAPTLSLSPTVVKRATQAARLLAAAGEEVRAGRRFDRALAKPKRCFDPEWRIAANKAGEELASSRAATDKERDNG